MLLFSIIQSVRLFLNHFLTSSTTMGRLSGDAIRALVSHEGARWFEYGRRRTRYTALEIGTRPILELGKERRPGQMVPSSPSSVPTGKVKFGHAIPYPHPWHKTVRFTFFLVHSCSGLVDTNCPCCSPINRIKKVVYSISEILLITPGE